MPARPPPRPVSRPAFRPPVHVASPPRVAPRPISPPVHHSTPPPRPPPPAHHSTPPRTNTVNTVLATALITNAMNNSIRHDEEDRHRAEEERLERENREFERANQEMKAEREKDFERQNENKHYDPVEEVDKMFDGWENGAREPGAKIPEETRVSAIVQGTVPPAMSSAELSSVAAGLKSMAEAEHGEKPYDNPAPQSEYGIGYGRTCSPRRKPGRKSGTRRVHGYGYDTGLSINSECAFIVVAMIVIVVIIAFAAPFIGNFFSQAPTMKHGSYDPGPVYVVDGDSGDDVSGHVSFFEIYVTNDTEDYGSYLYIGTCFTTFGIETQCLGINDSVYYNDVVVYTEGVLPYTTSWDYLTTGSNYIYLYVE